MDWKTIGNMDVYTNAERDRAQRDNIALNSPPLQPSDLPQELLARLQPHYTNWSLQDKNVNASELRKSDSVMLFEKQGKDWVSVQTFSGGVALGESAYAVSRRSLRNPSKGGGSGRGSDAAANLAGAGLDKDKELTPTVFIGSPKNRDEIELHDKTLTKQDFQDHTFKPGETVLSVVEELTGRKDSQAIYNYNNPPYSPKRPPQAMDTVRVAVGRSLKVSGTTSNSNSVTLTWTGPTNGTTSVGVPKAGDNEYVGWETEFKAKAGVYHLIATVAGAKSEIDVSLYGYEDEMFVFNYQLDTTEEEAKNDRVFLRTSDGWEHMITVASSKVSAGWVELAFPTPPESKTISLIYDKGSEDEVFYIFKDEPYSNLVSETENFGEFIDGYTV